MVLDFRVLGPAEVTADGRVLPLGGSRPLIVLAGLLLRVNRVVPVDELGRWLWDDDSRRSKGALQTYVLRLRRALGDQVVIRTESGGYRIELEENALDLTRFRALAGRGRVAMDRGDARQAAGHFAEALAQWRGTALLNVESDALHRDEGGQLAEERLRVREQWADALLAVGEYATVVPELTRLTRENPLRERLHEQLMVALYRSGRQAESLEIHRRISAVLADELGLDPGPALQRTHQAILTGTGLAGNSALYRVGAEPQIPRQLPADLRAFSGRDSDLKALHALLPEALEGDSSTPIASVEGMGGIGKTTLAVHFAHEVADRFPGGQVYLNLRGYGPGDPVEPQAALTAMLTALGVPCDQVPDDLDGRAASWRTHSAGRRLLVLLDNANSTEQVRPLLPGPGCLVVITTRWQLRALAATHGARRIAVEELPEGDAVELLTAAVGPDRVTRDPAATERFVRYCGGLPLAIRILAVRAAQFPDLPLGEFVAALEADPDRLGSFDLADGEGTNIRSVFSYSYQALEPAAARLLRLLGLPCLDFTVPAAAAVAGLNPPDARALLGTLASAHLLAQPRPGRFQFHDLIRAYAAELAEQVDGADIRDAALTRLLDWYLASALNASRVMRPERYYRLVDLDDAAGGMSFEGYHGAMDWFAAEYANLITAVDLAYQRGKHDRCWKLAWLLQTYFAARSRVEDWRSVFGVALKAARAAGNRPGEAGILSGLGVVNGIARQYAESRRYLEQVLAIQRELGAREGEARAHFNLTLAAHSHDDYAAAYEHGWQALEIVRELGIGEFEASVLRALGDVCAATGDHEQALALADQALAITGPDGAPIDLRYTVHTRGLALIGLGRFADGIACLREAADMFLEFGEQFDAADVFAQLGSQYLRHGDPAQARENWLRSLRLMTELGHPGADEIRAKLAALVGAAS